MANPRPVSATAETISLPTNLNCYAAAGYPTSSRKQSKLNPELKSPNFPSGISGPG